MFLLNTDLALWQLSAKHFGKSGAIIIYTDMETEGRSSFILMQGNGESDAERVHMVWVSMFGTHIFKGKWRTERMQKMQCYLEATETGQ